MLKLPFNKVKSMDFTTRFYSRPSYAGSGIVFSGARRQRGGSILGALRSIVMPIFSKFGPRVAKSVGNIAKRQVLGLASDMLQDKMMGKKMGDAIRERGRS